MAHSGGKQFEYEMSPDEVRIVEWLESHAAAERSAVPPADASFSSFQALTHSVLKESVAAQIRLGLHR